MEENKGFDGGNIDAGGGRFSQMMFASDEDRPFGIGRSAEVGVAGFNYLPSCFPVEKSPQMLCFGSYGNQTDHPFAETPIQKSGLTCSDSSSASSANTTLFKSSRKRSESDEEPCLCTIDGADGAPSGGKGRLKKTKTRSSMSGGGSHTPLGERVTALQQLVSPYGKSDTASVLHEALGYIRFLHDQVLALCSPYLQTVPSCSCNSVGDEKDLRSRGLCLVPVGCTARVPGSNGADFWSSARRNVSSYP